MRCEFLMLHSQWHQNADHDEREKELLIPQILLLFITVIK